MKHTGFLSYYQLSITEHFRNRGGGMKGSCVDSVTCARLLLELANIE